MFKITTEPKFTHKVTIFVPIDGGHKEESFSATFRVLDIDDVTALGTLSEQSDVLSRALVGFADVIDDEGNAVAYSDEMRDRLIATPYVRIGLLTAYSQALGKARRGN